MRQYADPPQLRVIQFRSKLREPDVLVAPSEPPTRPASPDAHALSDVRELRPSSYEEEAISSSELILEPFDQDASDPALDQTPVTLHSPWMRSIPPPLPRSEG